jgi:adenylate cyclase
MHKAWGIAIPGLLLVGAVLLRYTDPAPIQAIRNFVFDNYQRLEPRPYNPELPVRIADIDEKSLEKFGQWPWSRVTVAKVVDRLAELGAAVVAFDVLFAEPDRTSPQAVAANLPDDPAFTEVKARMAGLPDPDAQLAAALARMPTVLGFALLGYDPERPQARPKPVGGFTAIGDSPLDFTVKLPYIVSALPVLQAAAVGNGAVNADPDTDGVIRRVPLIVNFSGDDPNLQSNPDALLPALALEAIRIALQAPSYTIRSSRASGEGDIGQIASGIGAIRIEGTPIVIKTDRGGQLLLRDSGHEAKRFISVADLFDPNFPRSEVEGRIILIGTTVEGLKDIQTSPVEARIAGVEIHAQVIEQLLEIAMGGGLLLQRPYWSDLAEIGALVLFGILVIGLAYRAGAIPGIAVAVVSVAAAIGTSWYLFQDRGWLVDPLYPAGTALILVMAATTINFIRTEQDKARIRGTFSMYLSPEMVEQLAEQPEPPTLGGENREITVMFSDIRGFTKLSEGLDPQALTRVINAFLTPMSKVINDHKGTIDKYIGDCIMAFWNAPLDVPHHAREAVRAALEMRHTLKRLNQQFAAEAAGLGKEPVKIRAGIGLNTGIGCVGNMGSEQRMAYSALGDTVNTASRLESLSPAYFVDLVIGEETAADAADFALLELDQVKVKGKAIPIRLFTCLGTEAYAARPEYKTLRAHHDRMLAAYRSQDWEAAAAECRSCLEIAPERLRVFYALYEARIAEFKSEPPGADWDGVYVAKSKTG